MRVHCEHDEQHPDAHTAWIRLHPHEANELNDVCDAPQCTQAPTDVCILCPHPIARCQQHSLMHSKHTNGHDILWNIQRDSFTCLQCQSQQDQLAQAQEFFAKRVNNCLKKNGGTCGLVNMGNTCFMNATLQVLLHISPIVRYFCIRVPFRGEAESRRHQLYEEFGNIVRHVWKGSVRPFAPKELHLALARINDQFANYEQHDAQEFLRCLIGEIDDHLQTRFEDNEQKRKICTSFFGDLFQGRFRTAITCHRCGNESKVDEPFLDISVDFPDAERLDKMYQERDVEIKENPRQEDLWLMSSVKNVFSTAASYVWGDTSSISLGTLLHSFCTSEALNHLDQYLCSQCERKVNASKNIAILKLPHILSIHLKRFSHNAYWGSKIGRQVDFPLQSLDMSEFLADGASEEDKEQCIYDLCGIVVHSGSLSYGHYYAYVKHPVRGSWILCNDESVSEVTEDEVCQQNAYLLMYCKTFKGAIPRLYELLGQNCTKNIFVSMDWISKLYLFSKQVPVDNTSICCPHGVWKTNQDAVQVSEETWKALCDSFGCKFIDDVISNEANLVLGPYIDTETSQICEVCLKQRRSREKSEIVHLDKQFGRHAHRKHQYFIVSEPWLILWRNFVTEESGPPGPIDNMILLESDQKTVRSDLTLTKDYRALPKQVWERLVDIYGGGPVICRCEVNIYSRPASQL